MRIRGAVFLALISSTLCGCYLLQSAQGELSLLSKREPIERVIRNSASTPLLRSRLEKVSSIRDFASHVLNLPDNGSYRTYADVGRPYVVWNVVAAPEFSIDPKEWCYPIVGCVAYRGYFVERQARSFAQDWRANGYDVEVGGVAAYSTLGHFDDPILNTMLEWSDVELAGIIFHELTHQMLYVANDASFNEALATTVEDEGVRRWLLVQGRDVDLAEHLTAQRHYMEVVGLLRHTAGELRKIYASGAPSQLMRERKQGAFIALRDAYARKISVWPGRPPFQTLFAGDLNNAHLASIATYYDCVPGFQRELAAAAGDLRTFYARVRVLSKLDQAARDAAVCGEGGAVP